MSFKNQKSATSTCKPTNINQTTNANVHIQMQGNMDIVHTINYV